MLSLEKRETSVGDWSKPINKLQIKRFVEIFIERSKRLTGLEERISLEEVSLRNFRTSFWIFATALEDETGK